MNEVQSAECKVQGAETQDAASQIESHPSTPRLWRTGIAAADGSHIADSKSQSDPISKIEPGGEKKRNIGKRVRYRRRGNVARLAKAVRDRVNQMIDDGVPYREIIGQLGEEGKKVSKFNLSEWRKGGYKDWLAEQAFIRRTRTRQETPTDMVRDFDGTDVNHAALQLGTLHIFEALRDLGPGTLNEKLGGDCGAFARLLNALARASRETMLLQKYREAVAQARAALQPMMDPKRKLTDEERHAVVEQVNEILGLDQYEHDFEHQTPATGIIRLDTVSPCPEGAAEGGSSKSEIRNPNEPPNSEPEEAAVASETGSDQADGDESLDSAPPNSTTPSLLSPDPNHEIHETHERTN